MSLSMVATGTKSGAATEYVGDLAGGAVAAADGATGHRVSGPAYAAGCGYVRARHDLFPLSGTGWGATRVTTLGGGAMAEVVALLLVTLAGAPAAQAQTCDPSACASWESCQPTACPNPPCPETCQGQLCGPGLPPCIPDAACITGSCPEPPCPSRCEPISCAEGDLCPSGMSCDLLRHLCTSTPAASPPPGGGTIDTDIEYYHLDALGSVRMVTNRTGEVVSRHDYLPFGEEIHPSLGGRNQVPGYGASAGTRRFTGKERDFESGLDYFGARYMSGAQGRFTSPDPGNEGADPMNPQSWNGYPYALNNPSKYVDPDGRTALIGALIGAPIGAWGEAIRQINSGEYMSLGKSTHRILAAAAGGAVAGTIGGFGLTVEAPVVLGAFGGAFGNATEAIVNGEKPTPRGAVVGAVGGALGGAAGKGVGKVTAELVDAASGTVKRLTVKLGTQNVQAITHPNPIRARTFRYLADRTAERLEQIAEHALAIGHATTQHVIEVGVDQVHKQREQGLAARQVNEDQKKSSGW